MKKRNLGRKGLAILLSLAIAMSMMPTAVFASSVNVADTANTIVSDDGTLGVNAINDEIGLYADTQDEYKYEIKNAGKTTIGEWTASACEWEPAGDRNATQEVKLKYADTYGDRYCAIYITTPNTVNEISTIIGDGKKDYGDYLKIEDPLRVGSDNATVTWCLKVVYFKPCNIKITFRGLDTTATGAARYKHELAANFCIQSDPGWLPMLVGSDGNLIASGLDLIRNGVTYVKEGKDSLYYGYLLTQNDSTLNFIAPALECAFKSSNTDVATVANSTDSNSHSYTTSAAKNWGDITIHGPGTTTLTMSTKEEDEWLARSRSIKLVVKPKDTSDWAYLTAKSVSFNYAELPYNNKLTVSDLKKKGLQLVVAKHDTNGPTITYSSNDPTVVDVDSNGNLIVNDKGKCGGAIITVKVTPDATGKSFGYQEKELYYNVFINNPCVLDFTKSTYIPSRLIQLLTANGGTASYDSKTNKLTLNGINFQPEVWQGRGYASINANFYPAIVLPAGATVELQGKNKIQGADTSKISNYVASAAIFACDENQESDNTSDYQNLSITGTGSLDISGFDIGLYGMYVNPLINTGSITINQAASGGKSLNAGIISEGELKIVGGDVKIVKAESVGAVENIYAINAADITVSGGTLDVDYKVCRGEAYDTGSGVVSCEQKFDISGGKVDIDVKAYDDANALYLGNDGKLKISGGELNIKAFGSDEDVDKVYGIYGGKTSGRIDVTGGVLTVDADTSYRAYASCYGIGGVKSVELNGGYILFNAYDDVFNYVKEVNAEGVGLTAKYSDTYGDTNDGGGNEFISTDYNNPTSLDGICSFKATNLNEGWEEAANLNDITLFYSQGTYTKELFLGAYDGEVTLSSSDTALFTVENKWDADKKRNNAVIKLNDSFKTAKNAKLKIEAPNTATCKAKTLEIKVNVLPMVRYGFDDDIGRASAFLTQKGGTAKWDNDNKILTIKDINAKGCVILPSGATLKIEGSNTIGAASDNTIRTQNGVIGIGNLTVQGTGKLQINNGSMIAGNLTIDGGEITVPTLAAITSNIAKKNNILQGLFEAGDLSPVIFEDGLQNYDLTINGGTISVTNRVYANDNFRINGGSFTLNGKFSKTTVNGGWKSAAPQLGADVYAEFAESASDDPVRYTYEEFSEGIYDCGYFKATDSKTSLSNILGTNPTATVSYCDGYISTATNIPLDWITAMGDDTTVTCEVIGEDGIIDTDANVEIKEEKISNFHPETGDITQEDKLVLKLKLNDKCEIGETKVRIKLANNEKYADAQAEWTFTVTGEADFTKSRERALALINEQQTEEETGGSAVVTQKRSEEGLQTLPFLKLANVKFDNTIIIGSPINNVETCGDNTIKGLKGKYVFINNIDGETDSSLKIDGDVTSTHGITIYDGDIEVNGSIDSPSISYSGGTLIVASESTLFKNGVPSMSDAVKAKSWAVIGEKTDGSDAVIVKDLGNIGYDKDEHHYFKLSSKIEATAEDIFELRNAVNGVLTKQYDPNGVEAVIKGKDGTAWDGDLGEGITVSYKKLDESGNEVGASLDCASEVGTYNVYVSAVATNKYYAIPAGCVGKLLVSQDTTPISYTVSFDANGGTGTMNPETDVFGEYTLPENGFTAPTDKKFKGWATSENGEVLSGTKINVTANTTLYAIWEAKETGGGEEQDKALIAGTVESFDTVLNNAVIRLYSANCDDATIRSDMRAGRSQALTAYADKLTLGAESLSGSKNVTHKQSFEIKDVEQGEYKLAVYKAKRDGKDPYVVSIVKVTVGEDGTVTFEGNDSNIKMWLYGDVTWDGTINASDAEQVLRYATPGKTSKVIIGKDTNCEGANQFEAADITKDGSLNASDAEQILRHATPGKTSKKFEEITN